MTVSATPLNPTSRYIPVSRRQVLWVPTIANKNAPLLTELNAGTDVTAEIPQDGINGFTVTSDAVEAGDYANRFVSKVPGLINADDSSLDFYNDLGYDDANTVFTQDDDGFVVIARSGFNTTGAKMDVWPVRVASVSNGNSGTDPAKLTVAFTVTSTPAVNVAVPTS